MHKHAFLDCDLRQLNELTLRLFEALSVGICIVSAEGILQYANTAYLKMHGLKESQFVGKHVKEAFPTSADSGVLATIRERRISKSSSITCDGVEGITYRYPIINDNGVVLCAIAETIMTSLEKKKVMELIERCHSLEQKARFYEKKAARPSPNLHTFDSILGESVSLQKAKKKGRLFMRSQEPVLICGESGTGKELFAQALHTASQRALNPFISVNCAALPSELIESELFGYGEGAFTGSRSGGMKGKFEQANHGTIFLDEIAELPMAMQAKLLRVLETGELQKIAHTTPLYADFRLIAATNKNLGKLVSEGSFREDLYFRLNILRLQIPPLSSRREDIPRLTRHFIEKAVGVERAQRIRISPELLGLFNRYSWPGNVRELRNVLTYASCMLEDDDREIDIVHMPESLQEYTDVKVKPQAPSHEATCSTFAEASASAEKRAILEVLARVDQNRSRAARELKISRNKLYKKMHDLGML